MKLFGAGALVLLAAFAAAADPVRRYSEPQRLGVVKDDRLPEVSGILAVEGRPGLYWMHNDSGDEPRVLAVRETGQVAAVVKVQGAAATDWEDIAAGPGAREVDQGKTPRCLFVADTGNNRRDRQELVIWRFPEPRIQPAVATGTGGAAPAEIRLESEPAVAIKFRYPGEARDCEAMVVHPRTAHVYLLTKDLWTCWVHRVDGAAGAGAPAQTAEEIAELPRGLVTAADLSPTGRELVVRTYLEVQLYVLPGDAPFEEIFAQPKISLPRSLLETQGEAICFDPDLGVVTVSEAAPKVIHRITPVVERGAAPGASGPAPEESLRLLEVAPGHRVELAACEPQTIDPIAAHFDEAGRMWVVEMGDYPHGPRQGEEPQGRVRVLEDRDGDGRYEASRLFADGLLFPTGCAAWRRGLYVTTMRQVLYLEDGDGDGRADRREVVLEGFKDENNQLLPNHPTWAIDNRFYIANGLRATDVRRGGSTETLRVGGRDIRLDPFTGRADAVAGMSQFGMAFDDEGARFLCSNRNHIQHVVIEARHAERAAAAVGDLVNDIPDHGAAARIYPTSANWTTSNLHQGTFTAACGVHVYRGDLLPDLRGDSFTCDPTGNLVHHDRLRQSGGSFVALRVEVEAEILRSTQHWFRPVNLATGLDGALYIVDMCRADIEHPHWMPPEQVKRADFEGGRDRGRIWRLVPAEAPAAAARAPAPRPGAEPPSRWIELLAHPNGAVRDIAQRLLVENNRRDLAPALVEAARSGAGPLQRLHALWALAGLGALPEERIEAALGDSDPRLRRAGLRLAEPLVAASPGLARRALALVADPDEGVRFQAVLTAGDAPPYLALEPLTRIACADLGDPWLRKALLTAAREPEALAARVLMHGAAADPGRAEVVRALTRAGAVRPRAVLAALGCVSGPDTARWRRIVVLSLLEGGLDRGRLPAAQGELVGAVMARAAADAASPNLWPGDRVDAAGLLGFIAPAPAALRELLAADDPELRATAARSMARSGRAGELAELCSLAARSTPSVRHAIVQVVLDAPGGAAALVSAIERDGFPGSALDPAARSRLLQHPDAEVKRRAGAALGAPAADRREVVERYRPSLAQSGDLARGQAVFQRLCASCHRVNTVGVDAGPDISDTRERSAESLLVDILDPNRAVDGRYTGYTCTTRDGRVFTGVIEAETAAAVTLVAAEGRRETISRSEIAGLESSGLSLMPVGLEKDLNAAEMADLIAFLKGWRYGE